MVHFNLLPLSIFSTLFRYLFPFIMPFFAISRYLCFDFLLYFLYIEQFVQFYVQLNLILPFPTLWVIKSTTDMKITLYDAWMYMAWKEGSEGAQTQRRTKFAAHGGLEAHNDAFCSYWYRLTWLGGSYAWEVKWPLHFRLCQLYDKW